VAKSLKTYLSNGFKLVYLATGEGLDPVEAARRANASCLLVIPKGFSENVTRNLKASLAVYSVIRTMSMAEGSAVNALKAALQGFSRVLAYNKVKGLMGGEGDPSAVLDPIALSEKTIFRDRVLDVPSSALVGLVMSNSMSMPMTAMLLVVFAMQIAATSVASEKESKTLEMLLTLPVSRLTILIGKLTGSIVAVAFGAASFLLGFNYYMNSVTSAIKGEIAGALPEISSLFSITPYGYVLMGLAILVAMLSALALAATLAVTAEDVRSAQALIGYLYMVVFLPALILMFTDISALPLPVQVVLLAVPYTHLMVALKSIMIQNYSMAVFNIVYMTAFTVVMLYLAAKIYSTEKVLTLRFRIKRKRQ